MKKRIPSFAAGMLTMALIGGLAVSALAASGSFTITVDPINVQVNGEVFQPKDATGADVPVFVYNGTTYAPLRALAEAYGLEVGYDAEANMATVGETLPVESAPPTTYTFDYSYEEFKGLWEVEPSSTRGHLFFIGKDKARVLSWWTSVDSALRNEFLITATREELDNLEGEKPAVSLFRVRDPWENLASVTPALDNKIDYSN